MLWKPVGIEKDLGIKCEAGDYEGVVRYSAGAWGWSVKTGRHTLIEGKCEVEGEAKGWAREIAVLLANETESAVRRALRSA